MTKDEAITLLTKLVEQNMSQGGFKNFAVLDKLREALTVLKNDPAVKTETSVADLKE